MSFLFSKIHSMEGLRGMEFEGGIRRVGFESSLKFFFFCFFIKRESRFFLIEKESIT